MGLVRLINGYAKLGAPQVVLFCSQKHRVGNVFSHADDICADVDLALVVSDDSNIEPPS